MKTSLEASASGIIAEFKRKSPSKGWIKEDGTAVIIPASYSENGASAVSILTDEKYFGGNLKFIKNARNSVTCPILRKDFIIDEYQLYQARGIGADAVLLIAADLTKAECSSLAYKAHELGLETLLEIHSESELEYVGDNIDMVGVNNRNLGTFHTDVENSYRLASMLPKNYVLVSESGISNPDTVSELRAAGFRGFLIGETFMKTPNPGDALREFISKIK
jgi:indole-3-glycerol phosphate synthase